MDLDDIALFRAIAAAGSLSAAGRLTGLAPMAVSRRLAVLESQVGVRLFHRTTRALALTAEGEAFLPYAAELIETQNEAMALLSIEGGLRGTLRVTAPNVSGHSIVAPAAARLMLDHPALRVDLSLTDSVVDIAAGGFDLAVRVAPLQPSELIATRLADNPRIVCAAPDYLARFGRPTNTKFLAEHSCLLLQGMDHWPFMVAGGLQRLPVHGRFTANTVDAVRSACLDGAGIAMMTYWDVWDLIAKGQLEAIELEDVAADQLGIWAVVPTRRHLPPRVGALTSALRRAFTVRR